eukprot:TRINITY_DN74854_c0_g1_i1.p1 TRINITY_DN74854_c0_g1~~TRINITY_DN74854_c0_g1_i1.p1  ORF type:complete len:153 (+),score=65.32 TRINITY_DN74854_c0_g1_i1:89-547(+)
MQTLTRQMRFNGARAVADSFFKSFGTSDVAAAKAAFSPAATVTFVSVDKIHRVPFSGSQNAGDFIEAYTHSLSEGAVKAHGVLADETSFAAQLQHNITPKRNGRPASLATFAFGDVKDGKITSLHFRADAGALESVFNPHGPTTKGVENKWD